MTVRPGTVGELRDCVAEAAATGRILEVRGGGSKRDIGVPGRETTILDTSAFARIVDYEPSELVLTAGPGTPLTEIEGLLAGNGQMLAFEPWDHGPLFGRPGGAATIGGVVAAGIAGPRRLSAGGARDHLLGFSAVSGRGEIFKGGGKVVKNVTGYDMPKVIAGSWGQLAIMTELSLKVVPRPRAVTTVTLNGLTAATAIAAMAAAMGSRCVPAAAAHLPGGAERRSLTAIRVEGFAESVAQRATELREVLGEFADADTVEDAEGEAIWIAAQEAAPLRDAHALWRVHLAPSRTAAFVDAMEHLGAAWLCDWAGALVWVGAPADADIRAAARGLGGHAMLVRGPHDNPLPAAVRHPEPPGAAALAARVKRAFDPADILDPHRFD